MAQERVALVQAVPSVQETLNDFEEEQVEKIKTTFKSDNNSQRFASSVLTLICDEKTKHPSLIASSLYKTLNARAGTPQYSALLSHVTHVLPDFKNPKKLNNIIQFFTKTQEDAQGTPINGASDVQIIITARSLLRQSPVKSIVKGQIKPSKSYAYVPPPTGKFASGKGGTRRARRTRKTRKTRKYSKK